MSDIVAIVGRPNVGKSTLFNRLTGSRHAIVDEHSGVTRDRSYGRCDWNGKEFTVIDSGGYINGSDDEFEADIRIQVEIAIDEASIILFMVDVETGIMPADEAVSDLLRRSGKPVMLVVNKVDNHQRINEASEFYSLGLGEYHCLSSLSGTGSGDLLDEVVKHVKDEPLPESTLPRFAIVGRPNVGKSSFTNALLGTERNIVHEKAGTTRDSIDTVYNNFGFEFILVDTAGIRRKSKVSEDLEFYSVMRSIRAIENADVCLLMVDATMGIEGQDLNILGLVQKNTKGLVILVNKWDLVEKETQTMKEYEDKLRMKIEPFTDVPILFISALTKQRIHKALEMAVRVHKNRIRKIQTSKLNEVMLAEIERHAPPATKGKFIKIKYVTQLPTHSPSFAFFCNLPQYVKEPYQRYIENRLREHYDFHGVPIQIFFRKK
ncbi:MAG: GTP-binding protein [Bacteroidia bacterium]|jgi:GTP-binding protein